MKIFVTGATGLIGANSALELLKAGHELRLLVRNKEVAKAYFLEHGYDLDDFVVADMLDKAAVKAGMQGCDAVLHSAAIVDLDARHADDTRQTNLQSIDAVIGSACELGIEKIIYVSSMSVYYNFDLPVLTEETPLADATEAYSYSKKLCEIHIRSLQEEGYPIISTYPAMVFGPDDPKIALSNSAIITFANQGVPVTTSGIQFVDARDIGIAHRLLFEGDLAKDKTQERYIIGGFFLSWPGFADILADALDQKLRRLYIPGVVFRVLGLLFDWMRKWVPINFPISKEAMQIVTLLPPAKSDRLIAKTGMSFRPACDTVADTVNWMRKKGHF